MMNVVDAKHNFAIRRYQIQAFAWFVQRMTSYLGRDLSPDGDDDYRFEFVAQIVPTVDRILFELLADRIEVPEHLLTNESR